MADANPKLIKARPNTFTWKHIKHREGEYPELFVLHSELGDRIKVEFNRHRRLIRMSADTRLGNHIQSVISSGVIIREKDLNTGKSLNLDDHFNDLQMELSSLPDSEVLRAIGGNYGILTEFIGTVENTTISESRHSKWGNIPELYEFAVAVPRRIVRSIYSGIRSIWEWPTLWDLIDIGAVMGLSYYIFQQNFNFALAGITTIVGAISSGMVDWAFRRRDPYNVKIILMFIPGILATYIGFRFQ